MELALQLHDCEAARTLPLMSAQAATVSKDALVTERLLKRSLQLGGYEVEDVLCTAHDAHITLPPRRHRQREHLAWHLCTQHQARV